MYRPPPPLHPMYRSPRPPPPPFNGYRPRPPMPPPMGRNGNGVYYGDQGYYQNGYGAWDDDMGWETWAKIKERDPSPDRRWRVTKLKVDPTADDLLRYGYEDQYDPWMNSEPDPYWNPAPPPVIPAPPPPRMFPMANPRPYYPPLYPPAAPPSRYPVYY